MLVLLHLQCPQLSKTVDSSFPSSLHGTFGYGEGETAGGGCHLSSSRDEGTGRLYISQDLPKTYKELRSPNKEIIIIMITIIIIIIKAEELNIEFSREEIQMTNKYFKKYSASCLQENTN